MAILFSGQVLFPGQSVQADNNGHTLIMQTDGNAVLYNTQSGKATGCTMTDGEECWRLGFQDAEAGRPFHPQYDGWNLFCQQRYEEGRLAKVVVNSKAIIVALLKGPSHGH